MQLLSLWLRCTALWPARKWWDTSEAPGMSAATVRPFILICPLISMILKRFFYSIALIVKQAFPCLNQLGDDKCGRRVEVEIAQKMESAGLLLVGWYHSHASAPPTPTVQVLRRIVRYLVWIAYKTKILYSAGHWRTAGLPAEAQRNRRARLPPLYRPYIMYKSLVMIGSIPKGSN